MKRRVRRIEIETFAGLGLALVVGFTGCSDKPSEQSGTKSTYKGRDDSAVVVAPTNSHETSPAADVVTDLPRDASPAMVTQRYFAAVAAQDLLKAESLLTGKAMSNFSGLKIQPTQPAPIDAEMRIGQTRYTTQRQEIAYVETIWTVMAEGGKEEFTSEVCLRQTEGGRWRIAGIMMADVGVEPIFFNFEDYASLKTIHDEVGGDISVEGPRTATPGSTIR